MTGLIEREAPEGPVKKIHVGVDDAGELIIVSRHLTGKGGGGSGEEGSVEKLAAFHVSIRRVFP